MSDIVINAENISKKFCKTMKHIISYGGMDIIKDFIGIKSKTHKLRSGEFWAIKDINFTLKKGEILGLIGGNGSGKTTLLKIINGIYMPDTGKLTIRGRVGALIAVGAGFHPMLTGRENIYVNGQIIGMTKKEIDKKFDEIVDFAGIGDFIDAPVKHYSSGMYVRLGFSVAIHCEPDILLIDEVLSVGDIAFRNKCIKRINEIIDSGVSIIFVSHQTQLVESLCKKVLWVENSVIRDYGNTQDIVTKYINDVGDKIITSNLNTDNGDNALIKVKKVDLLDKSGKECDNFRYNEQMTVRLHLALSEELKDPSIAVSIWDYRYPLFNANMFSDVFTPKKLSGEVIVECTFKKLPLLPKKYKINVQIKKKDHSITYFPSSSVATFTVDMTKKDWATLNLVQSKVKAVSYATTSVFVEYEWNLQNK